jgi:alpha-amylase/alpha-mannosidase (GH57 family)
LDWLRDELTTIYIRETSKFLKDPWAAREDYIRVILDRSDKNVDDFLKRHWIVEVEHNRVLRMMEVQRNAMLMYTSCGWFFDDLSGIETTQIMQYACRAMQLVSQISDVNLEEEFLRRMELAPSNITALGNGREVYKKFVVPSKTNLQRVGMHYAVSSIFEEDPESFPVFNYTTKNEVFIRKEAGQQKLVVGITKVKSNVTRSEKKFAFAVIYMGQHNIIGNISIDMEAEKFDIMQSLIVQAFEEARLGDIIGLMQVYFGPEKYTIWQLFQDEKRKVFDLITFQSMRDLENSLRRIYNRDYPLVMALANNDAPIPNAYRTTFEYILNADLIRCFHSERINIRQVERITHELVKWRLSIEDKDQLERLVGESIIKELKRFSQEGDNYTRLERLNRLFPLLNQLDLSPNLYKSQNMYFEISKLSRLYDGQSPEWIREFGLLGENLSVKIE